MDAIIINIDAILAMHTRSRARHDHKYTDYTSIYWLLLAINNEVIVICMSNEKEDYRSWLKQWIREKGLPCDLLLMRSNDYDGAFNILQEKWYNEEVEYKYDIWFVLEDASLASSIWTWHNLQLPLQLINHKGL